MVFRSWALQLRVGSTGDGWRRDAWKVVEDQDMVDGYEAEIVTRLYTTRSVEKVSNSCF